MQPDDERDFRAFVAARSPALLRTARLLTSDRHAAEDLVQEALSRLVPAWSRVDDPEAYTRTAMHRIQISRWRRLGVLREHTVDVPPDPSGTGLWHAAAPPGNDYATVDERMLLVTALRRLTPRQRGVLVCRYVEDLDERRTADRLGLSIGTVRSTTHRALARLRVLAPELARTRPRAQPHEQPQEVTP